MNFHTYYLNSSICVWKSLVFQIVERSHWWSQYLRMLGKCLQLKTATLLVSKAFGKLISNRVVDHLNKCSLFSYFPYSWSTADLLTVLSDRIARAYNRSVATRAIALDIFKPFDRVWHADLIHKLKSYGISGQIFGVISSFLSNRLLEVILDGKPSKVYPVNCWGSILDPTLFLLYINDLLDDVICNIAIYADDTTLYSKCDQTSDLWQ